VATFRLVSRISPAGLAHGRARDLALPARAPDSGLARDRAGDRDPRVGGSLRTVFSPGKAGRPGGRGHGGLRGARIRRAGRAGLQPSAPATTSRLDRAGRPGAPPGAWTDAGRSRGASVTTGASASAAV